MHTIKAQDVLKWLGQETDTEELAALVADIANCKYNIADLRNDILLTIED